MTEHLNQFQELTLLGNGFVATNYHHYPSRVNKKASVYKTSWQNTDTLFFGEKRNNLLSLAAVCLSINSPQPHHPLPTPFILTDGLKHSLAVDFVIIIVQHDEHPKVFTEINRKMMMMMMMSEWCGIADDQTASGRSSLPCKLLPRARTCTSLPPSISGWGEKKTKLIHPKLKFVDEKLRSVAPHISPFIWKLQSLSSPNSFGSMHHGMPSLSSERNKWLDKSDEIPPEHGWRL